MHKTPSANISREPFGTTPAGEEIDLYTLTNDTGSTVKIMTYGGIVTSLVVPDQNGKMGDVVLGYDDLDGYLQASPYFGALVGRHANRIAQGTFILDGKLYKLPVNNGPNSLHGGLRGFDKVVWKVADASVGPDGPRLELRYLSPDGEEGFPGNLAVTATYSFGHGNSLRLDYTATTDQATIVNLTQHSYFNLRGHGDVNGHVVQIHADRFTPVDKNLIPTGELRPVAGTPFDFRSPTPIGARLEAKDEQLAFAGGYDHNWVLNKPDGALEVIATVTEPESGRLLEVSSTQPGLQFYGGNFLNGTITGKGGWTYEFRHGLCMEPQHFPDAPNQPGFPSTILRPGETYRQTIIYRLGTADISPIVPQPPSP